MAWADIVSRIRIYGPDGNPPIVNGIPAYGGTFTNAQKTTILDALKAIYEKSPTAASIINAGVAAGDIWIMNGGTSGSGAVRNSRTVAIDLAQAETLQWMGRDGQFQTEKLAGNIIHELIHAIEGKYDLLDPVTLADLTGIPPGPPLPRAYNHPDFDHLGLTVQRQNAVFQEMEWGLGYWQVGYDAGFAVNPLLRNDITYTEGNFIDIAYFDNPLNTTPDLLDLSRRTDNSKDLIIGFAGDDEIYGGAGNDYLYGSVGNDTIRGGTGNDLLHGGDRKTGPSADGTDTADYLSVDSTLTAPSAGIVVKIDAGSAPTDSIDGKKVIEVTNDGDGGSDRLLSIEKIKGSRWGDRVDLGNTDLSAYELSGGTLEIDRRTNDGGQIDVIDAAIASDRIDFRLGTGGDLLFGSSLTIKGAEKFVGSSYGDRFVISAQPGALTSGLRIDGAGSNSTSDATQADRLDFSGYATSVYVGSAKSTVPGTLDYNAVEIFSGWQPDVSIVQIIWNLIQSVGQSTGSGLTGETGVQLTNFEHIVGSSHNDVIGLWQLNPGGKLSEAQEAAFKAAQELPVSFASGDPATIGAALDARVTAAAQIQQNQQDVLIEGGAGDDIIVGTRTGKDRIYGGDGIDKLYAGGFTSQIYGEGGIDYLRGGGLKSQLYGGADADVFGLANHTFVMDATKDDFITWGPFHLTGGVAQWWMEGNWAYWTPFTSLISGAPLHAKSTGDAASVLDLIFHEFAKKAVNHLSGNLSNTQLPLVCRICPP